MLLHALSERSQLLAGHAPFGCWGLSRIHLPRAVCRREQMPAIKKKKCACTKAAAYTHSSDVICCWCVCCGLFISVIGRPPPLLLFSRSISPFLISSMAGSAAYYENMCMYALVCLCSARNCSRSFPQYTVIFFAQTMREFAISLSLHAQLLTFT